VKLIRLYLGYFEKAKDLRPTLYDDKLIGLGYTPMFLTHSDEALEIEKFKRSRENKIEFAYDYGNLNASYVNEKINFEDDYFQEIINPDFEKIDSLFQQTSLLKPYVLNVILKKIIIDLGDEVVNLLEKEKVNLKTIESLRSKGFESSEKVSSESENQSENDCLVVEKECDKKENPKVIAPGMFKLNVSQCVSPISMSKSSSDSNNVEIKLKRKRRKRKSSKQNVKQVDSDVSRANSDFVHFLDLDIFSSIRRPKNSGVIWKKKGSSNTSNVGLSAVSVPNLNKNVKRYSRKDLLAYLDIFGSVRRPKNSGVIWKKKGSSNTSNVGLSAVSVLNLNKNVKRYSRKDLLACNNSHLGETRSVFVCNDAMNVSYLLTGDRSSNLYTIALNEVASNSSTCLLAKASSSQSWLWHKRLSYLNFTTINNLVKNNLVQGLPKMKFEKDHLCSACEQGKIHQKHHKSKMVFTLNKPLYLLHMDLCGPMRVQSINGKRYVLVFVDDYSWYTWRVRTDNGTEFKNKTLDKFFDELGITQQFSAARTPQQNGVVERRNRTLVEAVKTMLTFANLPSFLWAEAIATACFTQNYSIIHKCFDKTPYELINKKKSNIKFFRVFGCRCYLLNNYKDITKLKANRDIGVFVGYSKESVAFRIYNKQTRESSSSSFNHDVQQNPEEVILPQTNTQSISNNMIPNGDEASTSHNVFNDRLEDAYVDASTSFHDPSNVHTYYQPYPYFIKKTQVNLQLQVQRVRTDNGTEFKNKTLAKFFDEVGITQQFSVARTP
nr:hypothetical protein [Tanacetum cinerariifolium]